MSTVIISLVILVMLVLGVKNMRKRLSSGCCGGGDAPRRDPVKDKNRKHYPFAATLEIGGMSCRNCAVHVENALNGLDGVWAKVDLDKREARVLMKAGLSDEQLTRPVAAAGYTVSGIRRV